MERKPIFIEVATTENRIPIGGGCEIEAIAIKFRKCCVKFLCSGDADTGGVVQSQLSQLNFIGEEKVGSLDTVQLGSCLDLGNVTDTVTLRDVLIWGE